jgi:hypothetical protein
MLPDRFFLWPYPGVSLEPAIAEIRPVLEKSGLGQFVRSLNGDLAEYIALECRNWNINPWWLLVSAQREQSTLGGEPMRPEAMNAWLGVVGQDVGRSANPGYYGIFPQVARCVEISAWLLGKEPPEHWPAYARTRKEAKRWRVGLKIPIEKDGKPFDYLPVSAGEYLQLAYTPHYTVLATNEQLARRWAPSQYL